MYGVPKPRPPPPPSMVSSAFRWLCSDPVMDGSAYAIAMLYVLTLAFVLGIAISGIRPWKIVYVLRAICRLASCALTEPSPRPPMPHSTSWSHAVINSLCSLCIGATLFAQFNFAADAAQLSFLEMRLFAWVRLLSLVVALTALTGLWWTIATLANLLAPAKYLAEGDYAVVTSGLFKVMRYPHYSLAVLAELAIGAVTGNLAVLALAVVSMAVYWLRHQAEDAMLGKLFKTSFVDYKRRVPALIPDIQL